MDTDGNTAVVLKKGASTTRFATPEEAGNHFATGPVNGIIRSRQSLNDFLETELTNYVAKYCSAALRDCPGQNRPQ